MRALQTQMKPLVIHHHSMVRGISIPTPLAFEHCARALGSSVVELVTMILWYGWKTLKKQQQAVAGMISCEQGAPLEL